MVKSILDQSSTFPPETCGVSLNAISSLVSEAVATPYDLLDGTTEGRCGPAHVRANPSHRPHVAGWFRKIYAPSGYGSWLQRDLAWSLVNRLSTNAGPILSYSTWNIWATRSGRRFCRLALSVSTMRANGFTLWATPTATANQASPSMQKWPGCRGIEVSPEAWCRRMGYPETWLPSLDSAMLSFPRSRKCSSKAISRSNAPAVKSSPS